MTGSAVVSSKPAITFRFWIAWPAAPLTRLSTAPMTIAVPVRSSTVACNSTTFDARTRLVSAMAPGGSTRTNGSPPHASASAFVSTAAVAPPAASAGHGVGTPPAAGAGQAGFAVDNEAARFDQAIAQQRGETDDHGRREAAGIGDELRAQDLLAEQFCEPIHSFLGP